MSPSPARLLTDAGAGKQPWPSPVWGRVGVGSCLPASIPAALRQTLPAGRGRKGMVRCAPPPPGPGSGEKRGRYGLHQAGLGVRLGLRPGCQVPRSREDCRESLSSGQGGTFRNRQPGAGERAGAREEGREGGRREGVGPRLGMQCGHRRVTGNFGGCAGERRGWAWVNAADFTASTEMDGSIAWWGAEPGTLSSFREKSNLHFYYF